MAIKEITMLDGSKEKLNTNFSLRTFLLGQERGLIAKDFIMQCMNMSQGADVDLKGLTLTDDNLFNMPYLAYLNNKEEHKASYEKFMDNFPMDMELLGEIIFEIFEGMQGQREQKLKSNFVKATPKNSKKSKKKFQK